jgi:sRNA-binding protein
MTAINGAALATAPAVSEGQIEERQEGLLDTKSKPNLATILRTVAELFPVFAAERWQGHKPLAIGIDQALIATGILKPFEVGQVLRAYCRRRMYLVALAAGGPRYDLDGNVAGEVTAEQAHNAKLLVEHMDAKAAGAAAKIRVEQKAAWLAEKSKQAATAAAGDPKGPRPSASAPLPVTSGDQPRRLGLADLRRAFQERKAAQVAVQGGA